MSVWIGERRCRGSGSGRRRFVRSVSRDGVEVGVLLRVWGFIGGTHVAIVGRRRQGKSGMLELLVSRPQNNVYQTR